MSKSNSTNKMYDRRKSKEFLYDDSVRFGNRRKELSRLKVKERRQERHRANKFDEEQPYKDYRHLPSHMGMK